jgi:hypothetical protein
MHTMSIELLCIRNIMVVSNQVYHVSYQSHTIGTAA